MGLLSRRQQPHPGNSHKKRGSRSWFKLAKTYSVEKRPSFGQWLKVTILDILTMIVLGVIALVVFRAGPAGTRTFPLTVTNTGEVVYPQFAYPYRDQIIAAWLATFLAAVIPITIIVLAQIRIRSFWDINNGIIGLIYALECSSAFQVVIKWLIGGLRPHFYDVCRPDPSKAIETQFNATGLNGVGYQNYMFTKEICTSGNEEGINNALESFPSGHTTTIFAGMVFLYLYLNAKLKVFSNHHPAMWKLILLYLPLLGAVLVGGALTIDQSHNWYDILAGAIIGTVFAFSAYRMVYAAIWDYRINHIPLNRGVAFERTEGVDGSDFLFCEHAGWASRRKRKSSGLPGPVSNDTNGFKSGHANGHKTAYTNGHGLRHPHATASRPKRGDDMV